MKKERAPLTYGPVYLVTRFLNYSFLYLSFITTDKIVSQRVRYSQHRYLYVYLYLQQYTTLGDLTFYFIAVSSHNKMIIFYCDILHLRSHSCRMHAEFVCDFVNSIVSQKQNQKYITRHMKSEYPIITM